MVFSSVHHWAMIGLTRPRQYDQTVTFTQRLAIFRGKRVGGPTITSSSPQDTYVDKFAVIGFCELKYLLPIPIYLLRIILAKRDAVLT